MNQAYRESDEYININPFHLMGDIQHCTSRPGLACGSCGYGGYLQQRSLQDTHTSVTLVDTCNDTFSDHGVAAIPVYRTGIAPAFHSPAEHRARCQYTSTYSLFLLLPGPSFAQSCTAQCTMCLHTLYGATTHQSSGSYPLHPLQPSIHG